MLFKSSQILVYFYAHTAIVLIVRRPRLSHKLNWNNREKKNIYIEFANRIFLFSSEFSFCVSKSWRRTSPRIPNSVSILMLVFPFGVSASVWQQFCFDKIATAQPKRKRMQFRTRNHCETYFVPKWRVGVSQRQEKDKNTSWITFRFVAASNDRIVVPSQWRKKT